MSFKKPSEIADQYLGYVKALKPAINRDQKDSDWWVKSRAIGGTLSGLYSDQLFIQGDIFPQTAREDALLKHLVTRGIDPRIAAQTSSGTVAVTGDVGTVYAVGQIFQYDPNGNTYSVSEAVTLAATAGTVLADSIGTGQEQNLLFGAVLSMPSAPIGHQAAQVVIMADGRNEETTAEMAQRILDHDRQPVQGGTSNDYRTWALEADGSVTSATPLRYPFGLGTMAVYITAGTTDIDLAIDNGDAIVRQPSQQLIDEVLAYIEQRNPETDCASVFGAQEALQDVTIKVAYADGYSGSSILQGQSLTLNQLVQREVRRTLYKIPAGGRKIGASGYVVASEIEEEVDLKLSAAPYTEGTIAQVILDRQVEDLSASGVNRGLLANEIVTPGTITVIEGVL